MHTNIYHNKGFTLVEIIVAMGIVLLLAALALVSFRASRDARDLSTSTQDILSIIRLAQSKTLAGEDDADWGVHLTQTQFTLFRGPAFAGSTLTETHDLPSSLELVSITLAGGGSDIIFTRVTGATNQNGSFILRVAATPATSASFTVDSSGAVYQTGAFSSLADIRTVDARHRSFDLGWSIKTATTMTLTFADPPNPDIVNSVTMLPYFDAGKTKFDWSGITSVGGLNQDLRIHTTSLTDTATILSIDRDCRKNTKKLTLEIDGKTIAAYEANCQTLTVGSFGGTVSEP